MIPVSRVPAIPYAGSVMFLGHFAAALVAGRAEPRLPLGTALLASELPDVIWPWLVLTGVEKVEIVPGDTVVTPLRFTHYPWSHSLAMVLVSGAALALLYRRAGRPARAAALVLVLAASHWVLDVISHRPDVPLVPFGGPLLGLGLWNSLGGTLLVEGGLFALGVYVFARGRRPRWSFWVLIATLAGLYFANLFGPPPPGTTAIALSGIVVAPILWIWGNRISRTL
jgi:LexA-binding, inner membrane-associated putative hydrolase